MIDKASLLTLLRESESYISGGELSRHFGVSRNAVWKVIRSLRTDGYEIEAVSGRGYRLALAPDIMSAEEIISRLKTARMGRDLHYYDSTDSTNTRISILASEGAEEGALAVSDMQEAGKGRRGRGWISPAGMNVYMSLLLKPEIRPRNAGMINLVMALAVCRAIEDVSDPVKPMDIAIKWPNDIVINSRKVCGILTEMSIEADYIKALVVGVGINVNQGDHSLFPDEIKDHASSIRLEAGHMIPRSELIAAIMGRFEAYYDEFLKTGDMSTLKDEYESLLVNTGREVRVLDPKGEFNGISRGIDNDGELLVQMPDGEIREIYAGEVSVRGLYGYV